MRVKIAVALLILLASIPANAVRLKDIADVKGIRDNQIQGYGLVVGLNGTGDKNQTFTTQPLVNMLNDMGILVSQDDIKVRNVAAVIVTAKLPPFAREGQKIDVTVSSFGDAKSLEGGTLLITEMKGPDGKRYAVAQGPLSVGGFSAGGGGATVVKNHPTVARIPNGANIEGEIKFIMDTSKIELLFETQGLGDIVKAKNVINSFVGGEIAYIDSPSTVTVDIPLAFRGSYYDFMNAILNLEIQPETFARIVVDERTGTLVMGSDVRISTVAIAHQNLTITISNHVEISQPNSFTGGETVVAQTPQIEVAQDSAQLMVVPEGVTVSDLVKALNAIGVQPSDLIIILQAIKSAGALHADLEVI